MDKKRVVFQSPIFTQSGYGHRARDIAKCLLSYDNYNVYFIPTNWGSTPWTALQDDSDFAKQVNRRIILQLDFKPDIFIQHTIPNEFNPVGEYNIGITAGIETNLCAPAWVEGMNRMDLIIGSTNHSINVLKASSFEQRDNRTNRLIKHIKPKPELKYEVLLEALDTSDYKKIKTPVKSVSNFMDQVSSDFAFLFVGQWLQGDMYQDRKNVSGLIKTFVTTFSKKPKSKQPALILKTSSGALSVTDEMEVQKKIEAIVGDLDKAPPIYLLYGDLSREEMVSLYKHPKVKTMVSFTRGEGFGRPLAEFAATGKPVMVSGWSGQLDFVLPDYHTLLKGQLEEVHPSVVNDWFIKGSKWFTVDYGQGSKIFKDIIKDYDYYHKKSKKGKNHLLKLLSFDKMNTKLKGILDNCSKKSINPLKIELPKL